MKTRAQPLGTIFAPLVWIALVSVIGLLSALTGDGLRDLVSWITLSVPVVVLLWAWRARRC